MPPCSNSLRTIYQKFPNPYDHPWIHTWGCNNDLYSHQSAVYGTQTDMQYTISTHIDLLCMWLKSIGCIWSVLTLTYNVCDSKSIRCIWDYSHRSAAYVSQVGTHCMFGTHIDLRYMWLKSICIICSKFISMCNTCDSKPILSVPYVQVSRQSAEYVQLEASSQCTYMNDQKSYCFVTLEV
jgi:hypothetical protein